MDSFWDDAIKPLLPVIYERMAEGATKEDIKRWFWLTFDVAVELHMDIRAGGDQETARELWQVLGELRRVPASGDPATEPGGG